jgi:hypothetical protein
LDITFKFLDRKMESTYQYIPFPWGNDSYFGRRWYDTLFPIDGKAVVADINEENISTYDHLLGVEIPTKNG